MSEFNNESIYSKRLKAGRRRTYFFDVRSTKSNDYFVTLTESKRKFNSDGYERHKIFLYKEDFNKFLNALSETINHVKTELMPDYDFDSFDNEHESNYDEAIAQVTEQNNTAENNNNEHSSNTDDNEQSW